jgi:hypothetical protein
MRPLPLAASQSDNESRPSGRRLFLLVVGTALLLSFVGRAFAAGDYPDPKSLSPPTDFVAPQAALLKRAESGDAKAQAELGIDYFDGIQVTVDHPKAMPWLLKAAEQDRPEAEYYLGTAYSRGSNASFQDDPPSDMAAALQWYEKAARSAQTLAKTHDPAAEMTLASLKWYGQGGVAMDQVSSVKLAHDAAEQGYVPAEWWAASVNLPGIRRTPEEEDQARKWTISAAMAGHSGGIMGVGFYFLEHHQKDRAKPWCERAATMGNEIASRYLLWQWGIHIGKTGLPG